jgi:F-type H+-transporting ATPase subunit b
MRNIFSPNAESTILLRVVIATAASVLFAGVAQASGASGDGHEGAEEVLKQTIYQGLNLALLLGVLFYFGRKPISEFFSSRRSGIQSELSEAADLLAQAEQRNSELQRRLVDLGSEVEEIREEAGRRAEEEAERILADARATAERIRRDAQAGVAQELRRAQSELREEAADLALEIAARKLSEQVGEADRERLVDEFILRVEANSGEGADR